MPDLFQIQLVHLTRLALQPAWRNYSWHRAIELEAAHPDEFKGLRESLTTCVRQSQAKPD